MLAPNTPVRSTPMPPRISFGAAEQEAIFEVLAYYRDKGLDPGYQDEFEKRYTDAFCAQMGGGYADAVATGTAALYVAVAALELPKGSEVCVSPITDPGTLSAIILNGLTPKLVDSDPGSFNMSAHDLVHRIGPKTSAVMLVHSLGKAAEIGDIVEIANARDIEVIEDCSQSHGAMHKGRPVGTFGSIAAFSTMYRKAHCAGGSGGMVYCRERWALHRLAMARADRGKPRWRKDFDDRDPSQFMFPALNLHTDEISCGIGLASLGRLQDTKLKRLGFVADLTGRMRDRCKVCQPLGYSPNDSPFVMPIVVDIDRISVSKTEFAEAVRAEGIPLSPHYRYLVADWPWVKPYLADDYDTRWAREQRDRSFCIYLNENYGAREAADCVAAMIKIEKRFAR